MTCSCFLFSPRFLAKANPHCTPSYVGSANGHACSCFLFSPRFLAEANPHCTPSYVGCANGHAYAKKLVKNKHLQVITGYNKNKPNPR